MLVYLYRVNFDKYIRNIVNIWKIFFKLPIKPTNQKNNLYKITNMQFRRTENI